MSDWHTCENKTYFNVYTRIYKIEHKVGIIHNTCEPVILEDCKYYRGIV